MKVVLLVKTQSYFEVWSNFYQKIPSFGCCLILAILKIKASIHMIAASGFFMFAVATGIHFQININGTIALMLIILGAIATSRLHLKAHNPPELLIGLFTGLFPQLIMLQFWL